MKKKLSIQVSNYILNQFMLFYTDKDISSITTKQRMLGIDERMEKIF